MSDMPLSSGTKCSFEGKYSNTDGQVVYCVLRWKVVFRLHLEKEGCAMIRNDNIVEQKSFQLLETAIQYDASDIHLVPTRDGYEVLFKKDAKLNQSGTLPPQLAGRMISFYKFLSSLDISDKRKPQSGSFHKQIQGNNFSFRVSTIPSIGMKESVVIRLQRHDRIVSLDELCIEKEWSDKLRQAVREQQGLILLTGPTGCGKTTTIYSITAHCVNQLETTCDYIGGSS